jgi:putative transposase
MPEYRRAYQPGGTFFLTLTTFARRPLFSHSENVERLRNAIRHVQLLRPFEIPAAVILPEHSHFLWTLPEGDTDYSARIGQIKLLFTKSLPPELRPTVFNASHKKHRDAEIWQRRFWEHTVRDENDFNRLLDYIHFNPVKHGHVACPHLWKHSSFHTWVAKKGYEPDWCCCCSGREVIAPNFDEIAHCIGE